MKTLLIFDLMYFSTWPIGGHSKTSTCEQMFDTRTTFLALSTGSLDLKTHFGRKNRKSLDSASAVTPAIFLRNTAEFSVNLIVHGNSIILRGGEFAWKASNLGGFQDFWFSNVGEPNHDKSCCYHPRLPQEYQIGRCYVFICFHVFLQVRIHGDVSLEAWHCSLCGTLCK